MADCQLPIFDWFLSLRGQFAIVNRKARGYPNSEHLWAPCLNSQRV